jgi:hypothetical protein
VGYGRIFTVRRYSSKYVQDIVSDGTRFVVCQYPGVKIRGGSGLIGSRQTPLDTVRNEDRLQKLHDWQLLNGNIL